MRILNWNIEWMNDWFVGGGDVAFRPDNPRRSITDVAELCQRVANVMTNLDPDVLTIVEGPSDIREMILFAETFLSDEHSNELFHVIGGVDGGAQKVYALVKKGGAFRNPVMVSDSLTQALEEPWEVDIDGDFQLEGYDFTRLPLVIEGTFGEEDEKLRIITLHAKSKYVHNGQSLWKDPTTRTQFVKAALKNRRRISSEAMRIRQYLNDLMNHNNDTLIVVTGDFNDGPGVDYFERYFLTHNVTDILLGSTYYPNLLFEHAFLERVPEHQRYTAIFDDFIDDVHDRLLLLDHILVSPALSPKIQDSGIAHQAYNAGTNNNTSGRQKYVSDHRPVYVDFKDSSQ